MANQLTMWECAARASRNVRERVLMLRADAMLTFTARGGLSRAELWQALAVYRDTWGDGYLRDGYVAVPEVHHGQGVNAGKYHGHVAVPKGNRFVDYARETHRWSETLRKLHPGRWAVDETCGTINVRECGRVHKWPRSKLAWYITKYITKDIMAGTLNCKRYACSKGIARPEITRIRVTRGEAPQLMALVVGIAHALTGLTPTRPQLHDLPGRVVISTVAMDWAGVNARGNVADSGSDIPPPIAAGLTLTPAALMALTRELQAAARAPIVDTLIEAATSIPLRASGIAPDPRQTATWEPAVGTEVDPPAALSALLAELERCAQLS